VELWGHGFDVCVFWANWNSDFKDPTHWVSYI